ncbi:flippase [Cronobacter dublinensis]|uniref:flippase n=1 Tax=Cronobacter dublinensis TaxID=413497 RepID=UPI002A23A4D3|nr:flippase [Cronobacter dublinensis]
MLSASVINDVSDAESLEHSVLVAVEPGAVAFIRYILKMPKNSLRKNIFYLFLVQGSSYLLPLITFPYLLRVLGAEYFGVLGFCQATMQYLVLLTDYGFNWTATQLIAKSKDDFQKISNIFWSVVIAKVILFIIALCILTLLINFVGKYQALYLVLISYIPLIIGNIIYPLWLFQGLEKMKWITISTILARVMLIPLTFIYVDGPNDVWLAALLQSSVNVLAGIFALWFIFRNRLVGKFCFSLNEVKNRFKEGIHVFLSTSAISLYTVSVTVILGFISGATAVGLFNSANTIRNAAQGLLGPVFQAIYPRINSLFDSEYIKAMRLIKKAVRGIGILTFTGCSIIFWGADFLINIIAGKEFEEAIIVLRWLAYVPFLVSLSNLFGVQTMLSHSFKKQFSLFLALGALLNLIIIFPLVHYYSEKGAAIAIFATELFITVIMFIFLLKKRIDFI